MGSPADGRYISLVEGLCIGCMRGVGDIVKVDMDSISVMAANGMSSVSRGLIIDVASGVVLKPEIAHSRTVTAVRGNRYVHSRLNGSHGGGEIEFRLEMA